MNKLPVFIADPDVLNISIVECGEVLVDVADYDGALVYGEPPECSQTAGYYTKMRQTVFDKVCRAQQKLPHGLRFRLYEGFRSLEVQQLLFDQELHKIGLAHPEWSDRERFHEAMRLASPVVNLDGTNNVPPHNTGAAIDIEIITEDGALLDMGMTAKDWSSADPDISYTHSKLISSTAQNNRQLLLNVLQEQEFVNYPHEWWHFSYGDRYWAYCKGQSHAIYGSVELQNVKVR